MMTMTCLIVWIPAVELDDVQDVARRAKRPAIPVRAALREPSILIEPSSRASDDTSGLAPSRWTLSLPPGTGWGDLGCESCQRRGTRTSAPVVSSRSVRGVALGGWCL